LTHREPPTSVSTTPGTPGHRSAASCPCLRRGPPMHVLHCAQLSLFYLRKVFSSDLDGGNLVSLLRSSLPPAWDGAEGLKPPTMGRFPPRTPLMVESPAKHLWFAEMWADTCQWATFGRASVNHKPTQEPGRSR